MANFISMMLGVAVLAGFASGLLMGVSFRMDGAVHPDSLLVVALASVCDRFGPAVAGSCGSAVRVLSILLSLVSFLGVVESVPSTGDWRAGVVLYVVSLALGALSVLLV